MSENEGNFKLFVITYLEPVLFVNSRVAKWTNILPDTEHYGLNPAVTGTWKRRKWQKGFLLKDCWGSTVEKPFLVRGQQG